MTEEAAPARRIKLKMKVNRPAKTSALKISVSIIIPQLLFFDVQHRGFLIRVIEKEVSRKGARFLPGKKSV